MLKKGQDFLAMRQKFVKEKGILNGNKKWILYGIGYTIYVIQIFIARLFVKPQVNKIAFMSYDDYSDNSRTLSEYLINLKEGYEIYWFVKEVEKNNHKYGHFPIKFISNQKKNNHYSWKTILSAYSCGIICTTHGFMISKKFLNPKQKMIYLWHGCGYKAGEIKYRHKLFDYVLVPGNAFIQTKKEFFQVNEEQILPIGYPRYDLLKKESVLAERFIEKLKNKNKKLVIWMPTFRNTEKNLYPEEKIEREFDLPILSNINELKNLNKYCIEHQIVLCIKRHPFQLRYIGEDYNFENIKFIDNEDLEVNDIELYSILQYTDALISDYSSISVDYMLLNKPIAYALDDYESYSNTRGFVFENPLDYMPGHHLYDFKDMTKFLEDIANNTDKYADRRTEILKEFHNQSDNYCEIIWNTILDKIKKGD